MHDLKMRGGIFSQGLGVALFAVVATAAEPATQPAPATRRAEQPLIIAIPEPVIDPSTGKPRVAHAAPEPGQVITMTIKELGNFPFDPQRDTTVPADVAALDGAKVSLQGFIELFDQNLVLTEFAVVPELKEGAPSGVQHTIICRANAGQKLGFIEKEVKITGTLTVQVLREADWSHTVFQLQVDSMAPVK